MAVFKIQIMYGLFDTQDKVWIGNLQGPLLYNDVELAQVAAMVVNKQLDYFLSRIIAKPYDDSGKKIRDIKDIKYDAVTVINKLER